MNVEVNYLAILLAVVVSMAAGFLWYSPVILGKQWMRERGLSKESLKAQQKEAGKWYAISAVATVLMAYMLSHVMTLSMNFYGYEALQTGLTTAFFMWLGFVFPVQFTATIFSDNKNWKLLGIYTGYQLVSLLLMGVVLGLM